MARACPSLKASFLEKALCRSERVADAQIHTGRAGVGHTRRAADQADAGAVLVVDARQPGVQRGALGEVVDISDRIFVGLAAAAREGRGVAAELGAGVLDAQAACPHGDGCAQVETVHLPGGCAVDGLPLQAVVSAIEQETAEVVRGAQHQVFQIAGCGDGAGRSHGRGAVDPAIADTHVQRARAIAQVAAYVPAGLACARAGGVLVAKGNRELAIDTAQVARQEVAHGVADARAVNHAALAGGVVGSLADRLEQIGLHTGGGVGARESGEDVVAGGVVATQPDFTPGIVAQPDRGAALEAKGAAAAASADIRVEAAFKPELSSVAAAEVLRAAQAKQAGLALAGVQCIEPVAAGLGNGDTDVHHTKNGDGRLCQGQAGRRGEECAHRESQNARARFLIFHWRDTN